MDFDFSTETITVTTGTTLTISAIGALILPSGATADRPGGPTGGWIRNNTDLNVLEYYNTVAAAWQTFANAETNGISALSTTGLVVRTGSGTYTTRTITGTANQITLSNGDGVAANPTISLPSTVETGNFRVTSATASYTSTTGIAISVIPGAAATLTSTGNNITITGGPGGGTSGDGGTVSMIGGTPTAGAGGAISVSGSAGVGTNQAGGTASLVGGNATGTGVAGGVTITGGTASGAGTGGSISLTAGTTTAGTNGTITFTTGGTLDGQFTALGSLVLGNAALATNATDGFLYVAGSAGTPTGIPTSFTGRAPLTFDTTNNLIYWYTNGAWRTASAGSVSLSSITAAAGANSINNGDNAQTWNWALTTASKSAFTFTENTAAINGVGAQYLLDVSTIAASTANPIRIRAQTNNILTVTNVGVTTLQGADTGTGSAITIRGGNSSTAATAGATATLQGGTSGTSGTGGNASIIGGVGGTTGVGGTAFVTGGAGGGTSGNAGGVTIAGGIPVAGTGGAVSVSGSAGVGTNQAGGAASLVGGNATGTGVAGGVTLTGGTAAGAGTGGSITMSAGSTTGGTNGTIIFNTAGTQRGQFTALGSLVLGNAAVATNATDGFLYITASAGTPTGVPTTFTGRAPVEVDSTNNLLYFYSGGAWRASNTGASVSLSTITAAAGANSINNGDNAQTWNWALTTVAKSAFTFTENTAAINGAGAQYLLDVGTIAASTANPIRIRAQTNNILTVTNVGVTTLQGADTGTGSAITIRGGNSSTAATAGANATVQGGTSGTSGTGGNASVIGGVGGTTGVGGTVFVTGGAGGGTSGNAGGVTIAGGVPVAGAGGTISISGSAGVGTNQAGGGVTLTGGNPTGTGTPGSISLTAGALQGIGTPATVGITGGAGNGATTGGAVNVTAGSGGGTGVGAVVTIRGGPGGSTSGNAGAVTIIGGTPVAGTGGAVSVSGSAGVGTNQAGGAASLVGGNATGTGVAGGVTLTGGTAAGAGTGGSVSLTAGTTTGGTNGTITATTGGTQRAQFTALGSLVLGNAALATNATDGFLYVAGSAGTPTGVPTAFTGRAPLTFDTTNNLIYWYTNGAWRTASGGSGARLDQITAATALNTIDSTDFQQTWKWNLQTVAYGLRIEDSGASAGGALLSVDSISASAASSFQAGKSGQVLIDVTGTGSLSLATIGGTIGRNFSLVTGSGSTNQGGSINIQTGNSGGADVGPPITMSTGDSVNQNAGDVTISTGNSTGAGTRGGNITLQTGGNNTGAPGNIFLIGGAASTAGGNITLTGGESFTPATAGGTVTLFGGSAQATSGANGGPVIIKGGLGDGAGTNGVITFQTANTQRGQFTALGSLVIGTAALTTTATDGFLYIPTTPGVPTGVPTTFAGRSALTVDTTNNRLYGYDPVDAVWLNLTGAGGGGAALSGITAAVGANSINNGDNAQTWNWQLTTASKSAFTFTENTAAINGVGAQYLLDVGTIAASTANPIRIRAQGNPVLTVTNVGVVTIQGADTGTGSAATIRGGNSSTAATAGGAVTIQGGTAGTSGTGGSAFHVGGIGGTTGTGGTAFVTGGAGGSTSGNAGGVTINGGTPVAGAGGTIAISSSNGVGTNQNAGNITLTGGNPTGTGTPGSISLTAGALQGAGTPATVSITGGAGNTGTTGGAVNITGGSGGTTGVGAAVTIRGGPGGSTSGNADGVTIIGGTPVAGAGGTVTIQGSAGVGTNQAGGAVNIDAGNATGSGTAGSITIDAGRSVTGTAGTVTIVGGAGGSTSGNAGAVTVTGGTPVAGTGAAVTVSGSAGVGTNQAGGAASLVGGNATGTGVAGAVTITGGTAAGAGTGGNISLTAGTTTGGTNGTITFTTGGTQRGQFTALGSLVIGTAALATNATDGFLYIPTTPGVPTGVPTTFTGRSALTVDTTNDRLYGYDPVNAVWLNLTGSGGGGSPGGADTQIQYNNAGAFGGDADFTWNATTNTLTLGGTDTGIILNGITTEPTAPAAGTGRLYAKSIAARVMPKWVGPSGVDYPLQAHIGLNNVRVWRGGATTTATTFASTIGTLPYTSASPTAPTIPTLASTNLKTQTVRSVISTGGTAGALAYIRANLLNVWRGNAAGLGGYFVVIRFSMAGLQTNNRVFAGLQDTAANPTNVDPTTATTPGKIGMAINASTGNWNVIHNLTGAAPTIIALGASYPVDTTTLYELILFCAPNGSGVNYRVTNLTTNTSTSGTISTNQPANTTFLAQSIWCTNNATAAAVTLDFVSYYAETDY